VQRWWEAFKAKGTVEDAPRSGRPPKIPDAAARQAATIISQGYTVQRALRQQLVTEHKYFSSVPEAVAHNATLQGILEQYHATPDQLLNALHRAAPELVHRKVIFRHQLTQAEKAKRQRVASQLLLRHQNEPNLLQQMVFIDEASLQTHGLKHDRISVWVNSTDPAFRDYHGVPGQSWSPVKVHVIAAVTSHPAFRAAGGLVYVDFTSGTTAIRRRENRRLDGSTRVSDFEYSVSGLPLANKYLPLGTWVLGQAGVKGLQSLGVCLPSALAWHHLVSIARAQHNPHKTLGSSQGFSHNSSMGQVRTLTTVPPCCTASWACLKSAANTTSQLCLYMSVQWHEPSICT